MAYQLFRPMTTVQGVLFDMDGVILDSEGLYTRFWQEAAQALGYPMTRTQAMGMRALNRQEATAKLESYFGKGVDYLAVRDKRIELMDAFVAGKGIAPKPGIRELLDHLNQKSIPTCIATSSPLARVREYLEPLGLFERFDAIITGYDVPRGKPEPDIYLKAAQVLQKNPKDCIALEDSKAGLLSAFRAGTMAIMIPDQDRPDPEDLTRATALCDSLTDVIDLIGK